MDYSRFRLKYNRQEPCLNYIDCIKERYKLNCSICEKDNTKQDTNKKQENELSGFEIVQTIKNNGFSEKNTIKKKQQNKIYELLVSGKRDKLIVNVYKINELNKKHNIKNRIKHSGKKINDIKEYLCTYKKCF